jgi:hypothetical protein
MGGINILPRVLGVINPPYPPINISLLGALGDSGILLYIILIGGYILYLYEDKSRLR